MDTVNIQNLIKEIIEKITNDTIEINEGFVDEKLGDRCFSVLVNNAHPFLAREGEGLNALNHLVRRIIESKLQSSDETKEVNIMVDINGFQKKKIDSLRSLVHMMAERARYFKSSVELEPMSAYERRIVHEFLSDAMDLKTESDGLGRNRRVIIKYTGDL